MDIESSLINDHTALPAKQFSQIVREAVRVIKHKRPMPIKHRLPDVTHQFRARLSLFRVIIKELQSSIKRLIKCFLLNTNRVLHMLLVRTHLGKDLARRLRNNVNQLIKERLMKAKGAAIPNGT